MKERDIFDAALAIDDPAQRAAYLEQACQENPALREHIAALLEAQGHKVTREFYYNDAGAQIDKLAWSVQARAKGCRVRLPLKRGPAAAAGLPFAFGWPRGESRHGPVRR